MMGGSLNTSSTSVNKELNTVRINAVSTHLHPLVQGTQQSALHRLWGPFIAAARPVRCNGKLKSMQLQFDSLVGSQHFLTHGFFKEDWEIHV